MELERIQKDVPNSWRLSTEDLKHTTQGENWSRSDFKQYGRWFSRCGVGWKHTISNSTVAPRKCDGSLESLFYDKTIFDI